ncbi:MULTISPECIES: amino acid ABC transporter permease [Pelosinus]|jgi:cystine transport system permease protein|uniref:Polar amino acid ABC transporter, inner membrane subunit n=1 Tax=Pelosinus fermentans B4 TaxID=1149862 RepID=I9LJE2_9FIRM|nr:MULTISPECIES: amino acid ABC transporter permease [Pelosinus]EIW20541.1 polar amino acid ABC transporter, inner membrane subunit [Pelosinus fermentans B4]EIW25744.1 polar amino acid ABC transporter, inner membrane subunit [Pelosinus fermentans A11]OAM93468.1 polar amino acid ABC transporter, inner membrane subunit [Pelosinus fermentans DSM 17108]SDQ78908.1 amino acid ABC transporter membrane protein, PAAT family [Pelosinus fermentans]
MLANREWDIVIASLSVLGEGAMVTIYLSVLAMLGAVMVGLAVALMRIFKIRIFEVIAKVYVSFFRGTPLLVQLLILYFGLTSFHIMLEPFPAALIGLILHFGAYISEIFRGAIVSIHIGQWEAGRSLGMSTMQVLQKIVLPQALRISIPSLWNCLIDILKSSSLASVITVPELTRQVEEQSSAQFVFMPYFLTLAVFYWVMVIAMGWVQEWLEKKLMIPGGSSLSRQDTL